LTEYIFAAVTRLLFAALCVITAAVWARVILGCFSAGEDTVFSRILFFLTEPFLLPVRRLTGGSSMLDHSAIILSALIIAALAFLRL